MLQSYDIQIIGNLLHEIQTVESYNEKQRIVLSQSADFYPEIAFTVIKNYERKQHSKNPFSNFFDFSSTPDQIQYNFINSLKEGQIAYQNLQEFLLDFEVQSTDKQLEIIFKQLGVVTENTPGITYEQFLSFISPFSFPAAKHELLRRKVIYEANGINDKITRDHKTILAQMLSSEIALLKFSEISKLKLIEVNWVPARAFEAIDVNRHGFLSFETISKLFKLCQKQFSPRDYLGLLRRMKKSENCDTISFQDFTAMLMINQPYFNPQSGPHGLNSPYKMLQSQSYTATNKGHPQPSQQKPTDAFLFIDQQGRIVEKPHPAIIQYVEKNPQVNQIINQNNQLANLDPQIYPLLPQSQYDAHNYNPRAEEEDQHSEVSQPRIMFEDQGRSSHIQREERKRIFQAKDTMMKNFDPQQKKQLSHIHPLFQEMQRIGQAGTVKQDLYLNENQTGTSRNHLQQHPEDVSESQSSFTNQKQSALNIMKDLIQNNSMLMHAQTQNQNLNNTRMGQSLYNQQLAPVQDIRQKQKIYEPITSARNTSQYMQQNNPQPSRKQ